MFLKISLLIVGTSLCACAQTGTLTIGDVEMECVYTEPRYIKTGPQTNRLEVDRLRCTQVSTVEK